MKSIEKWKQYYLNKVIKKLFIQFILVERNWETITVMLRGEKNGLTKNSLLKLINIIIDWIIWMRNEFDEMSRKWISE